MVVFLSYVKSAIGKFGMIYAIGHLFGLKAEHILLALGITALEGVLCIDQEIARIELNAGHVGIYLHYSAALGLVNANARVSHGIVLLGEIDAMVITSRDAEGLVRHIKITPNSLRCGEIKGCTCHGDHVARGNKGLVGLKEAFGIHPHFVIEDLARSKASEIEI